MNAPQPNVEAIRTHLTGLHDVAKNTGVAGVLVLASYAQDPETGIDLPAKCRTFAIGDVEGMTAQALAWTVELNRNVYASLVVMRPDLTDGKKGGEADIACVFGLVADFDDARASQWPTRTPMQPTFVLETSPSRYQTFYLFGSGLDTTTAKILNLRLQTVVNADDCAKDLSHVFRIDGCLNWPNAKKAREGRARTPWLVRDTDAGSGELIKAADLSAAIKDPATSSHLAPTVIATARGAELPRKRRLTPPEPIEKGRLSTECDLVTALEGRSGIEDKSELFFQIVCALDRLGYADTSIAEQLSTNEHVTPARYVTQDRVLQEVRAALRKGTEPLIHEVSKAFVEVIDRGASTIATRGSDAQGAPTTFMLTHKQFAERLASEPVPRGQDGKPLAKSLAEYWLRHHHHQACEDGFVLRPDGAGPHQYNLWQSWGVRPDATADDSLIMRYLSEVLGKRQPRRAEALLKLLAHAVQHPGRRWNVVLILTGGQGVGKTTLAYIMSRIFGPHSYKVDTLEELFTSFNGGLLGKVFVSVEEGASGGKADVWNRLKPFITADTIRVNEKYRPEIAIPNMTHLMITTNAPEKIKVDHDDRRCWMFGVERTWERADFVKLYAAIQDDRAVGKFLHRLLTLDIQGFDPQADRPMTEALAHVKELSFVPEETIVRDWLQQGHIAGRAFHTLQVELHGLRIPKSETLTAYQTFMRAEHRGKLVLGRNHWYKRLGEMLAGAIHEDKPCAAEREFIIPDLTEARQAFERYAGQPLEWEEPSEVETSQNEVFKGHR